MKGTFDNKDVYFTVEDYDNGKGGIYFEFEKLYGSGIEAFMSYYGSNTFTLCASSNNMANPSQESKFVITPSEDPSVVTFEDEIAYFIKRNFNKFSPIQRIHALCFLERYCMDYQEVFNIANDVAPKEIGRG